MNDYYETLDLPSTATLDAVKAQYERLIGFYQPDQFDRIQDREFVEHKLQEIEDAHRALSELLRPQADLTSPTITQSSVDFGTAVPEVHTSPEVVIANGNSDVRSPNSKPGQAGSWFERLTLELQVARDRLIPFKAGLIAASALLALFVIGGLGLSSLRTPSENLDHRLISSTPIDLSLDDKFLMTAIVAGDPILHVSDISGGSIKSLNIVGRDPTFSQTADRIAFVAPAGDQDQLHVIEFGSDTPKQMTEDTGNKSLPQWSPNGQYIAFLATDGRYSEIRVVTAEGEAVLAFSTQSLGSIDSFAWSPDGMQIAACSNKGDTPRVYLLTVENGQSDILTNFDTWDPAWSPDGSRIAVASARGIYTMSPSGSDLRRLNVQPAWSLTWLPPTDQVGGQIAFLSDWHNPPGIADLWIISENGGRAEQVTSGGRNVVNVSRLSDGLGIAYVIANGGERLSTSQLWMKPTTEASHFVANVSRPNFAWIDLQ